MTDLVHYKSAAYPAVTYNRAEVKVAILDGKPWWHTARIFNVSGELLDETFLGTFAPEEMGWHDFNTGGEPIHVVTTIGALTIAARRPYRANNMAYAWLRKKHGQLTAVQGQVPIRMPISILADGSMPPLPDYLEERREWNDLGARHRQAREALAASVGPVEPPEVRRQRLIAQAAAELIAARAARDSREATCRGA